VSSEGKNSTMSKYLYSKKYDNFKTLQLENHPRVNLFIPPLTNSVMHSKLLGISDHGKILEAQKNIKSIRSSTKNENETCKEDNLNY